MDRRRRRLGAPRGAFAPGPRRRRCAGAETGRVLWLAQTSGGVRSWTTLSFSERLGAFPAPAGPEERLVTKAIEAARTGRTHRLGGVLALADISHIVALDAESRKGLGSQSELGPQEEQGTSTIYRNDAWRGPAVLLSAPPKAPLSPQGLADVVRDPQRVEVRGWPYGPVTLRLDVGDVPTSSVVYLASGHRGGTRISGAQGHIAAAGAYVPASDVNGTTRVALPGRWWNWMLPLQALIIAALLGAWLTAAYIGAPLPVHSDTRPELQPMTLRPAVVFALPAVVLVALVGGWSGRTWGVGTPFLSSAWYCPPIGPGFQQRVGLVNPNTGAAEFLVRNDLTSPPVSSGRINARSRRTIDVDPDQGAVIESYGRRLVAATEVARFGDRDASLCTPETKRLNVFPEGGRAATKAVPRLFERYVLFNPFPDLARASVTFHAADERISPPALQDIQIPPGKAVLVDPESQFEPMLDLSTVVRVWQGRALVARRLRTIDQVTWGLPSDESTGGVLPRATTSGAATTVLAVNLTDDPVHVEVSGVQRSGSLPEQGFDVEAGRRGDFELASVVPNGRDLIVRVRTETPVALESLVAPDDRETVSLMPPLQPERRWVVPLAEERVLNVVNPSSRRVTIRFARLGIGPAIDAVTIDPYRVARIRMRGTGEFGVLVTSDGGGVVVSSIGPRGSIPGVPFA